MTVTADATLALIDGALDDYTSEDAMRWTPAEPPRVICDGGWPLTISSLILQRDGTLTFRVSRDRSIPAGPEPVPTSLPRGEFMRRSAESWVVWGEVHIEVWDSGTGERHQLMVTDAPPAPPVPADFRAKIRAKIRAETCRLFGVSPCMIGATPPGERCRPRGCPRCHPAGWPQPQRGWFQPGPKAARIRRRR